MNEEKLLTVRDASLILGVSEREVVDLAESGGLPAYKVGGVFLRFKKEQVLEFKRKNRKNNASVQEGQSYPFKDKFRDFLYFNDFYILSALIITLLLFVIFQG